MKTPREILLARHQAAEPKLNALRARALAALSPHASQPQPSAWRWLAAGREFFHVPRVAWAGLAAAWLVIITLNVASRDTAAPTVAAPQQMVRNSKDTMRELRDQKRLFAELVGSLKDMDAEVPRFLPRPRSELNPQIIIT